MLLAIDPSTRETGWAIFSTEPCHEDGRSTDHGEESIPSSGDHLDSGEPWGDRWILLGTGVISFEQPFRRLDIAERISIISSKLDTVVETWHPQEAIGGKPSTMQLPQQQVGMEMLANALEQWARGHSLPLHLYLHREVRAAILGSARVGKERLAYAVMTRWGLLGERKSTPEWNAIAIGDFHLSRQGMVAGFEV